MIATIFHSDEGSEPRLRLALRCGGHDAVGAASPLPRWTSRRASRSGETEQPIHDLKAKIADAKREVTPD